MSAQATSDDLRDDPRFEAFLRRVAAINPQLRALPEIGQVVGGKYRIDALLGRGALGAVFRAVRRSDDQPLALKWMLHSTPDRRSHHRLMKEVLAGRGLKPLNVIEVYDLGREGHFAFVTMELLRGESLRERLQRGPLAIGECLRLLLPPLQGLWTLHRAGVFHRALEPDSFFLCSGPDGAVHEAKLLDTGVANVIEAADDEHAVQGALPYMALEQLEGSNEIGGTADVYAVGAVLYEALTGARPFAGQSRSELAREIATTRPKDPRALRPELPARLSRVLLRALGSRREARYATLQALIAALAPFAREQSPRRTWVWVAAAVAALALLLAAWWLIPGLAHRP